MNRIFFLDMIKCNSNCIIYFWVKNIQKKYLKYLTFESICPLTIRLPMMSIIVPPTKRRAANIMAFHGIFTGGFTNC